MQSVLQLGMLKRFRRTAWRFQETFRTPLESLPAFAGTIFTAFDEVRAGVVVIDSVVFQSTDLEALLSQHGLSCDLPRDTSIQADTFTEMHSLLIACFKGWIDFLFVPAPKSFVFYADHDEYTTFFSNSRSKLGRVADAMKAQGFVAAEDYARNF